MTNADADVEATKTEPTGSRGLMKYIGYIWSTKHTGNVKGDAREVIQRTLRELKKVRMSIIPSPVALGTTSSYMFYYTKVMTDLFLNENRDTIAFKDIKSMTDFWEYARGPLIKALYWNKWYNKASLKSDDGYIYYENKLLGVPRLRQLRIKKGSCVVAEEFRSFIDSCYGRYISADEDTGTFGRGEIDPSNKAWVYQSSDEIDGFWYWGKLAQYSGGGYVQDLGIYKRDAESFLRELFDGLWISRGTRAVFVSFTVYNGNVNLFCIVTLLVEFPATGGALPSWDFNTVRLIRNTTTFDRFLLVCEIFFVLFIIYYSVEEVIEIFYEGLDYFKDIWNIVDILLLTSSIVSVIFTFIRDAYVGPQLDSLLKDFKKYADFASLGFREIISNSIFAITLFLAWVKVFKYISFNKTMTQLATTLNRCAKDLLGFFIMFFIVFLAFTQLGFLLFGSQVEDFSTFMSSFFTLFRIILGDFDFYQLEEANRILGPIFFMMFVFFVFFVLINMFLAIINDTYSEVKSDMSKQSDLYIMSDYLKQGYNRLWNKATREGKTLEPLEKDNDEIPGRPISVEEWKEELTHHGYSQQALKSVFQGMRPAKVITVQEQGVLLESLKKWKGKKSKDESMDEDIDDEVSDDEPQEHVPTEEFVGLVHRVDHMESTLGGLVHSIDTALTHLGKVD